MPQENHALGAWAIGTEAFAEQEHAREHVGALGAWALGSSDVLGATSGAGTVIASSVLPSSHAEPPAPEGVVAPEIVLPTPEEVAADPELAEIAKLYAEESAAESTEESTEEAE